MTEEQILKLIDTHIEMSNEIINELINEFKAKNKKNFYPIMKFSCCVAALELLKDDILSKTNYE